MQSHRVSAEVAQHSSRGFAQAHWPFLVFPSFSSIFLTFFLW
jgi:hypothetical protein